MPCPNPSVPTFFTDMLPKKFIILNFLHFPDRDIWQKHIITI